MTMRDQCIEAMARAMLKPWAHRDFNEQELAGARKDATICLDTLLEKLKSPTEEMIEALKVADNAIREMFRYFDGGETRGSYDGKPERAQLRKAGYHVAGVLAKHRALKARRSEA